jgi:branched-chain amino acid aminotransferase
MPPTLSLNGRLVDRDGARVSALDRGLLYGDGVFEVMRAYQGVAFALEEHLGRLLASATRLAMSLPVPISRLRGEVDEALHAAGRPDAHVRVLVTRGEGDLGVAPSNARDATRLIVVTPLPPISKAVYAQGVKALVVRAPWVAARGPTSGAKTLNYLPNAMWAREARAAGADEAIVVGHADALLEGAASNVFVVHEGVASTPPLDAGILGGLTRGFVLRCAASAGVRTREAPLTLADLWTADEVFLTSSVRELVPVVRVDDHEVGEAAPGPVTRALHRAYRALTPAVGAPMPWD